MSPVLVNLAYLIASGLFVFALKALSHPRKAVRGNLLGALGMLIAVVVTLGERRIVRPDLIALGLVLGAAFGVVLAVKIRMTAMPQLVGLFNGLGGAASALVAGSALVASTQTVALAAASAVSGLVGTLTFSGSMVAMGKLQGWIRATLAPSFWQRGALVLLAAGCLGSGAGLVSEPAASGFYGLLAILSLFLGVVLVLPIGGADMPVVIAFLNACSGLAAAATGFVLMNQALIIAGSLVGASGLILTGIMCRAMNRSLANVLFGKMGAAGATAAEGEPRRPVKSAFPEEVAMMLEAAARVIIVPGYGMAVAQAQRAAAELAKKLQSRGVAVDFAIHPVAGRMPGHMNVLLAEADVDYDLLKDLEASNPEFPGADVVLVVGANDVVNPSARTDRDSPIYGMPILDVDRARAVVVLKRSMGRGFSGVDNPLFTADNTVMLFGDAKESLIALVDALGETAA